MCWSFFEEYLAVITFKLVLEPIFKKQNVWCFLDEHLANIALQLSNVPLLGLSRAHPIFGHVWKHIWQQLHLKCYLFTTILVVKCLVIFK